MRYSGTRVAGALFLVAVVQFILGLTIAEALYPGYSASDNYISDLGIGPSSIVFNSSALLLGALALAGTLSIRKVAKFKNVFTPLVLMAAGAMGVGVFTEDARVAHGASALTTFVFSGLSAIASYRVLEKPLSTLSIVLGAVSLGSLVLYLAGFITSGSLANNAALDSSFFLGLGPGGMERMIIYPALVWLAALSGYLATIQER